MTHLIHYGLAALLLGLGAYAAVDHVFTRRRKRAGTFTADRLARLMPGIGSGAVAKQTPAVRLTVSGRVRAACLSGLMITGGLMVVKNLSGVYFSHAVIIALNLAHLGLAVVLTGVTVYCLVRGRPWLAA